MNHSILKYYFPKSLDNKIDQNIISLFHEDKAVKHELLIAPVTYFPIIVIRTIYGQSYII